MAILLVQKNYCSNEMTLKIIDKQIKYKELYFIDKKRYTTNNKYEF